MLLEMINGKKLAAVILAAVIGTAAVSGCGAPSASQDTAKETEATQAGTGATGAVQEEAEAEPAAEGASQDMASQSADENAEAEPAAEGASQVTASQTADENAGVTAAVPEVSGQAGTEAIAEIPLSEDEMQQAFDSAVPYEDGFTVVIHSSNGDEIVLDSSEGTTLQGKTMPPVNGSDFKWTRITGAAASSTLYVKGYDYSVWNMLDWNPKTCWAEGNPYSEGTMEGFAYATDYNTRIDGFRIYPGYQKSAKVYRNNIVPLMLMIEVGGQEIYWELGDWLYSSINDGTWYWADIYLYNPVYSDGVIYVYIGAVTAFSSNPDYDCCISEFHPFRY